MKEAEEQIDRMLAEFRAQPLRFSSKKDELSELQERWTSLIRNHGFKIVKEQGENKMMSPDLFEIANEIDAFFIALKSK